MEEDQLIQDLLTKSGKEFTEQDIQDIKSFYEGDTDRMIGDILTKSGAEFEEQDIADIKSFYNVKDKPIAAAITPTDTEEDSLFGPTLSTGSFQPETGLLPVEDDILTKAINRGLAQADLADIGIDAINLQEGILTEDQVIKSIEANKRIEANPISESSIAVSNAKTFAEGFKAWARDPFTVTGELFTQSVTSLVKSGLTKIGTATAIGGAAGSIPGALAGAFVGMGVANYQLEAGQVYLSSITEAMQEHGLDPNKPTDWQEMFKDEEVLKNARRKATIRGLSTTLTDLALGKLAGVVAGTGSSVARVMAGAGIEFVGEGVGEGTAQVLSGEEFSPGEIVAETAGGGGGPIITTIEVARNRAQQAIDNSKTRNSVKKPIIEAVAEDQEGQLKEEFELSETVKEVTSEQAEQLKSELDKFAGIKETIPEDLSTDQKKRILSLIDEREELQNKQVDPSFLDDRNKKIDNINAEIKRVAEEKTEEVVETPETPSPFVEDFKLQGNPVKIEATNIDTGKKEVVEMDALEAQNRIKNMLDRLQKVKDCL